jgi:cephalosporin hydroxylase
LIPLSVIKKIQDKFPQIPLFCIVPEGCWGDTTIRALGEDTWFYRLVELCGIEVICDTSVQCLHMELKTGKYTAHPAVDLNDYITNMPVTTPLALQDRNRVSAEYIARIQQPSYINGIGQEISLAGIASAETNQRVIAALQDVQCTQNWWEVAQLCERVKALQPKTILEIGVDRGGSMNLWCQFAPKDARYIGVDNAMQFVIKRDTPQEKTLIEADSTKPETLEKVKAALNGAEVDFLFIDGDHTEAVVRSDYEMYAPLVRQGGIIAFHDIDTSINQEHCKGIKKLWGWLKTEWDDTYEFVNTEAECHFGIGMIEKE